MKTASTFLYDLVHTLSKSEKRYIKVQASGEKDYIHLLDALLTQKTFDENKLINDNDGANFLKHLAVNKRYLYELLLESLARFGQKTLEDKILEKITATNVLIEKGLFTAAFSKLRKGQKIAKKYEFFELQIMLTSIEKKLLSQRQFKKQDDDVIYQIFNVEVNSLEQLKNTNEYWYIAQKATQFQIRFQKIQNKEQQELFESLTRSPKFHDLSLATNFKSKFYFYQANAIYQFMLGNVEKAYETNSRFLDLLEAHPHFLRLYAEQYLATLNNMLIDSLVIGKYDILEKGIERLEMTLERPEFKSIKDIESRVFRQRYLLLINWSLSQKDFEKVLKWVPDIEAGLDRFGKKIEKHHRVTFYYLVAYLLFQNNRYDQAIQWNNLILNDPKEDVVKEIFHFSRILNLLIHYELGNYTLLESLLLSTPKYLKSRRAIYATEKALFRFLRKLLNAINKTAQQELIADFKNEIHTLFQLPNEKRVFNYLDLRLWIGS
ncbi:MAG: hypothetical protein ACI94Y_004493 [Maribacter sp.]|jgi:hypothetical protein